MRIRAPLFSTGSFIVFCLLLFTSVDVAAQARPSCADQGGTSVSNSGGTYTAEQACKAEMEKQNKQLAGCKPNCEGLVCGQTDPANARVYLPAR